MLGKPVPDFSLSCTGTLYFYDLYREFCRAGARVFGISRDSRFPFERLSNPDEAVCQRFGVMKKNQMHGKKVRGIERSTFVLDGNGVLAREWRGVKVPGHAQEVMNFVKAL